MILSDLSLEDFSQRYQGTYVKIKHPYFNGEAVVTIEEVKACSVVIGGKQKISYLVGAKNKGGYLLNIPIEEFDIVDSIPASKNINVDVKGIGTCIFYYRNPERQYKRGTCGHNVAIWMGGLTPESHSDWIRKQGYVYHTEVSTFRSLSSRASFGWDWEAVEFFFNPQYPHFQEALRMISHGECWAKAFHPYYSLHLSDHNHNFILCRKLVPIAEVKKGNGIIEIQVAGSIFKQELMDLQKRNILTNCMIT